MGINDQVNSDRLRIILNRPLDGHCLSVLMRKSMRKYEDHFGQEPWIYNKGNLGCQKWLGNLAGKKSSDTLKFDKPLNVLSEILSEL